MKIISQIIKYERSVLNKILKSMKENVTIVFIFSRLTNEENQILNYLPLSKELDYTMFKEDFYKILKDFVSKIIHGEKLRMTLNKKDAYALIREIIDRLKLYDFCVMDEERIICLDHEGLMGIINKKYAN